jgi:hypothetical protein
VDLWHLRDAGTSHAVSAFTDAGTGAGPACAGCGEALPSDGRADKVTHNGACRTKLWRQRKARAARDACVTGSSPTTARWGDPRYTEPSPQDISAHRASDGHHSQSGRGWEIAGGKGVQLTLFETILYARTSRGQGDDSPQPHMTQGPAVAEAQTPGARP